MKRKYIDAYLALENDEEVETVEEVVGYYLVNYMDEALQTWKENLSFSKSDKATDKEVTRILETIFRQEKNRWLK